MHHWLTYAFFARVFVHLQLANVGPLVYGLLQAHAPKHLHLQMQTAGVATIVAIGTLACILLSQLWYRCSQIGGDEHSTALLVLAFFLALVDCTSSVVFLPFLAHFPVRYLNALYFGEGLSGLLPASLALIQFENEVTTCQQRSTNESNSTTYAKPHCSSTDHVEGVLFPPGHYFGALAAIMLACGGAFMLLRNRVADYRPLENTEEKEEQQVNNESILLSEASSPCVDCGDRSVLRRPLWPLLLVLAWLAALANGALPAVSSYAYMPYGQRAFLLTTVAGIVVNPCASLLHHWLPCTLQWIVLVLAGVATAAAFIVLGLAGSCPRPMACDASGVAMVVCSFRVFLRSVCADQTLACT